MPANICKLAKALSAVTSHTPLQPLHQQGEKRVPRTQKNCLEQHPKGGKASVQGARKLYGTLFPFNLSWLLSWEVFRRRCASQRALMQPSSGSWGQPRSPQRANAGGASISADKQVLGNVLAPTHPLRAHRDPTQFPAIRCNTEHRTEEGQEES